MPGSEGADSWHPVRYLSADGVKGVEGGLGGYMLPDILYYEVELIKALRCLGVEVDISVVVEALHIL